MAKIRETGKRIIESEKEQETVKIETPTFKPQQILTQFINLIEIEEEISYKNIKVFPLHLKATDLRTIKLKTLDEALKDGILEIQETSIVGNLKFINKSKTDKILIVEGDIVQGGRQNRVINITMILDEDSQVTVPTSCVEQGRWHGSSSSFSSSSSKSTSSMYRKLNETVYCNYAALGGKGLSAYASDQPALWNTIDHQLSDIDVSSPTNSFLDSCSVRDEDINDYIEKIMTHIKDCCGLAAVIGSKIVVSIADSVELFMPSIKATLKSHIIDALSAKIKPQHDVEAVVKAINDCIENKTDLLESPNRIGQIIKLISPNSGSAFLYKDSIVNMQFVRE